MRGEVWQVAHPRSDAPADGLSARIDAVVRAGNCSGCGACATLSPAVRMELVGGQARPVIDQPVDGAGGREGRAATDFDAVCPGVAVRAARWPGTVADPILGRYVSAWTAWASDPGIRFAGSSGGVLTALSAWLLETGTHAVIGAGMDKADATRTVSLALTTKAQVLASAGSRYAPVSNTALLDAGDTTTAFVGKPCEAYAARQLAYLVQPEPAAHPVVLSFFCAGVPSQQATDDLVGSLGVDPAAATLVRYRGQGWPGRFTATDSAGRAGSASYEESWGRHLGPHLQDRCKICPDGTGEHADIAVGDFWHTDSRGFPEFADSDGCSVAIARTKRGHQLLLDARAAGVLTLGPVDLAQVKAGQPLQVTRKRLLWGRLWGRRLAGRVVPRYPGYGLVSLAIRTPVASIKAARGSYVRARRAR